MTLPEVTCYRGYRFGEGLPLTDRQRDRLIRRFEKKGGKTPAILSGRQAVQHIDLDDLGPLVVKHYIRGGWIRHVNRQTHLRLGPSRGAREMAWLEEVRRLGIHAPQPVLWADDGGRCFHRCWLVTRAIPETVSLAQTGLQDLPRARAAYPEICRQMAVLIMHRVHHTDMHPGNILLDAQANVFLLDFDKAGRHRGSLRRLAAKYHRRWQRAVFKYGLPQELDHFLAEDFRRRWHL